MSRGGHEARSPGASTDQGQVRDANEDGYVVDRRLQLFAVADGMGGHRAGEIASATALEALRASVAVGHRARRRDHERQRGRATARPPTTTSCRAWARRSPRWSPTATASLVGHVGDSRAYLLRDGELRQLTTDHSLVEELDPRRHAHRGAGRGPPAAVDHHPRARRRGRGRGRRVPGAAPARRPAPDLLGRAHARCCAPDDIAELLRRESDPTARRQPPRRRRQRRRRRGQHHDDRHRRRGRRRRPVRPGAASVGPRSPPPRRSRRPPTATPRRTRCDGRRPQSRRRAPRRRPRRAPARATPRRSSHRPGCPRARPRRRRSPTGAGRAAQERDRHPVRSAGRFAALHRADPADPRARGRRDRLVRAPHRTTSTSTSTARSPCTRAGPAACCSGTRRSSGARRSPAADLPEDARLDVEDRKEFADKGAAIAFVGPGRGRARPRHQHDHDDDHHDDRRPAGRRSRPRERRSAARRRTEELGLGVLALVIVGSGYVLLALSEAPALPPGLWGFLLAILGLFVIAHLAVRRLAPDADATLLPLVAALLGIGFVTISRLDLAVPDEQAGRADPGAVDRGRGRRVRRDARARPQRPHARALPLHVPAARRRRAAAAARARHRRRAQRAPASGSAFGPLTVQPGEAAKVLLVVFFAAYLVEKRELLSSGSRRLGRMYLPDPKHLGPLLAAVGRRRS